MKIGWYFIILPGIAACQEAKVSQSRESAISVSDNVSLDSGALRIYIPSSLVDTGFSTIYDTGFDEVFLIDSFYNQNRTLSIAIKRETGTHIGNIREDMVIMPISQNIHRLIKEKKGDVEIFKADTVCFNKYTKGGLISYIFGDEWSGLVILVLHPSRDQWYRIDINYKRGLHFTDSIQRVVSSIMTHG